MHVAINGSGGDWIRALLGTVTGLNCARRGHALILKKSSGEQLAQVAAWATSGKLVCCAPRHIPRRSRRERPRPVAAASRACMRPAQPGGRVVQRGATVPPLLVDARAQVPQIHSRFPFTEEGVTKAFEQLKSRRTKGKVLVDVAP